MDNEKKYMENMKENIKTENEDLDIEIEANLEKIKLIDQDDDALYKLGEAAQMLGKKVPTLRNYVDEFAYYLKDEIQVLESGHRMITKKGILMLDKIFAEKENGNLKIDEIKQLIKETDGVPFAPTPTEAFSLAYKHMMSLFEVQMQKGIQDYSSALLEMSNKNQEDKIEKLDEKLNDVLEANKQLIEQNNELKELLKTKENKGLFKNIFGKK